MDALFNRWAPRDFLDVDTILASGRYTRKQLMSIALSTILSSAGRVRKQSMAQAVDQLERTGYVERRPNPRDHRSRLVLLTQRGALVPPVTHAAAERVEERWAQLTSPAEFEALRASLLRLLTELKDQ